MEKLLELARAQCDQAEVYALSRTSDYVKFADAKIEGINSITMAPTRNLFKGALVPGTSVEITINEENFTDEGEIQAFARVLSSFMSSYASINSYIQLSLVLAPSNHKIVIQPRLGERFQL